MKRKICVFFALSMALALQAHEGHHGSSLLADNSWDGFFHFSPAWMSALGKYHLVVLHFPIALIVMTVVAEILAFLFPAPLFTQAARFMIYSAAVFAPITAALGFAFAFGEYYEGLSQEFFAWHRYLGVVTAVLAIIAAILKERSVRDAASSRIGYYCILFFLFLSVSLTGAFGGSLAFG